jgi:gamma-butyrobetaine dioxygenase
MFVRLFRRSFVSSVSSHSSNDAQKRFVTVNGSRFHHVWLRDNCQCAACVAPSSGQRFNRWPTVQHTMSQVQSTRISDASLTVRWADGHESVFSLAWLRDNAYDRERRTVLQSAQHTRAWTGIDLPHLPAVQYDDVMRTGDDRGLYAMLRHLADTGVVVVNDAPKREGVVGPLAERIAYLQRTLYGSTFHVKVVPNPHNAAYSATPLPLHIDLCYYESPPGLQFLHFIATECRGGANQFVDMRAAAERLRQRHADAFATLLRAKFTFHFRDANNWMYYRRPLIAVDADTDQVVETYWSPPWRGPMHVPFEDVEATYDAVGKYDAIVNGDADLHHTVRFDAGQVVVFNNRRIAHSRLPFEAQDGMRHAEGTYVSLDEFCNRLRVLQARFDPQSLNGGLLVGRQGNRSFK